MTQHRRWTWTLNNPTPEEEKLLERENPMITYIVFGKERGKNNTPHLQGYLETKRKKTLSGLKKALKLSRIHLEPSIATATQNRAYCTKEDQNPFERGEPLTQGKRSDLEAVVESIKRGVTVKTLWEMYPTQMIRYSKGIITCHGVLTQQTQTPTFKLEDFQMTIDWKDKDSIILWGQSGVGKTSLAHATLPKALIVSHMDDLASYNTETHEGIIFDDMDFRHLPRTSQIHLVDSDFDRSIHIRYQTAKIPKKTKKIFTTNELNGRIMDIDDPAIRRRIEIIKFLI